MSSVGKVVYKISDVDKISFGEIVEEKTENEWCWYRISWTAAGSPANVYTRTNYDPTSGWFRSDTVRIFEPDEMISQINEVAL